MIAPLRMSSAMGVISLLDEPRSDIKEYALERLNDIIDEFWHEISDAIVKVESLSEDETFKSRGLAALVASKIYYHLGSFDDCIAYALDAGNLFDISQKTEYVDTVISKCIDKYTEMRKSGASIDPKLENIINRIFERNMVPGQFELVLGLSLDTHRMDILEQSIERSGNKPAMLSYAFKVCMSLIENREYRDEVLRLFVKIYKELEEPDYINMIQCYIYLDDAEPVQKILDTIQDPLLAYQIAFDLYESATQNYLSRVADKLTDTKLRKILNGEVTVELQLQFLIRKNHVDPLILRYTRDAVRNSICHSATVIANGLMNYGTTSDTFLRENLEWLGRAVNWAKFTATASLGVIHHGHEKDALHLLNRYLPKIPAPPEGATAGYTEGGALYALGLIYANHGLSIIDYLLDHLKESHYNEAIRHGACLGLGLAAMGTNRSDIYVRLRDYLYHDDAVTGEGAGIAMGLVMLGSNSTEYLTDMITYAGETQHEKILRGLSVGIGLMMFGCMEQADAMIASLEANKDALMRRAAMHAIAMAYCGSGNLKAISKLLHVAVSDVNDDVRRAAVISIGFILFRNPEQCTDVVSLLSESYNPHVRCGAALSIGICCAGSGSKEAVALLEPMLSDPVNFVRQAALIASALVLIQQTEILNPKVKDFRKLYAKVISDKHEDVMAKFGAIIAQGIIDAGGRNVTVSLQSRSGHTNVCAVVGMLVFTQYWYWFPLTHFISLAFQPTYVVGLNEDLKMPNLEFLSEAKPSTYSYPPPLEAKKEREREKVSAAILSITAKAKRREASKKDRQQSVEKMEVDEEPVEEKEEPAFGILNNPARIMPQQLQVIRINNNARYLPLKDPRIGGIIMMKDTKPNEKEDIIEPVIAHCSKVEEEKEVEPPEPFEFKDE